MQEEKEFIAELLNLTTQNQAFQRLIVDYQRPLYNHIRNIVLNHDDADDVLQNTFIKIFQNLKNFKGESKLFSWMYRIATNEADVFFDGNEIQLKLQKAIALLPEKQQLIFKMKYFEELKYEEISEILGTSVGALKASYHIAVKKIEAFVTSN